MLKINRRLRGTNWSKWLILMLFNIKWKSRLLLNWKFCVLMNGREIEKEYQSFKADFLLCILLERESRNHAVRLSLKTVSRIPSQVARQSSNQSFSFSLRHWYPVSLSDRHLGRWVWVSWSVDCMCVIGSGILNWYLSKIVSVLHLRIGYFPASRCITAVCHCFPNRSCRSFDHLFSLE